MDRQRILVAAGGTAGFAAFVALGAFIIVSLAPTERPVTGAKGALLMETTQAPRPFNEPPPRAAPPQPAMLREPSLPPEPPPQAAAEAPPAAPPATKPAPQAAQPAPEPVQPPPQRRQPRTSVAALPPAAGLPESPTPQAIAPRPPAPRQERAPDGVLTPSAVRRFRLSLRLTRDQEPYWLPVEQALLEIGAQQMAMVRAGQDPKDAFGVGAGMRMYGVARPLLDVLREDQKARVREQAKAMGFGSIASSI